jgi:HNH endonuclease
MTRPPLPSEARPVADPRDPRETLPGYAVRADGSVLWYDVRRGLWIASKLKVGPGGFRKVRLVIGGKVREIGLARIVLRAFTGPRPVGHEPLHYPDPDPGNNRADNLRWAPRGASKVGRQLGPTNPPAPRGEAHPFAVLTANDIPRIRSLYRAGLGYAEVAEKIGVSAECVRQVLIGKTWRTVPDPLGPVVMRGRGCRESEDGPLARLDWPTVAEIRQQLADGVPRLEVARRFGISKGTVQDILKGRTWRTPPDD